MKKTILFSMCSTIMIVLFIEISCRFLIYLYSGDSTAFLYGCSASMRYENRTFNFFRTKKRPKVKGMMVIAAFGGSTTYGYNYSLDASSWPAELSEIMSNTEVRNFGKNGMNSNYALSQLAIANHDGNVDIVLWANYVNESDMLYRKDTSKFLLLRLDKTLTEYLLSYWITHKAVQFLRDKIGLKKTIIKDQLYPTEYALENYIKNFEKALSYCKKNEIIFICIRLPSCPIDKEPRPFIQQLETIMIELTTRHDIPFIDVNSHYRKNKIFCVANHQDLNGHQKTAKYILKQMKTILKEII
jgi:hypothetical protein